MIFLYSFIRMHWNIVVKKYTCREMKVDKEESCKHVCVERVASYAFVYYLCQQFTHCNKKYIIPHEISKYTLTLK